MNALVTGGGGFLGGAIIRLLLARGDAVRSVSRSRYPALPAEQVQGDLAEPGVAEAAVRGCDVVFHVAAKAGVAGRYRDYHRANVEATRRVIDACRAGGVRRLVFTSSPSVVFDGRDIEGGDESLPYPAHYHAHYPATKAEAERAVLAANDTGLSTVALRPHLIWGPGDNHLVPRILERGRAGRLRRVGEGKRIDSVYIDNAAEAHLLAADRLPGCAGRAYFISNGEPLPTWELVNRILAAGGVGPVAKSVHPTLAYLAGWALESAYGVLWPDAEPPVTRFVARELATSHWFDLTAARRDLGYEPRVSIDEGLRRLAEWLRVTSPP
ncbi:MAG: NAD-dependent epimerase/dehydratase family protein [Gemmataceae bacterium]